MQNEPAIPLAKHAPPLPKPIWRRVWIGAAIASGLLMCLLCTGVGVGGWWLGGRPAGPVGKNDNGNAPVAVNKDEKSAKVEKALQIKWKPLTEADQSRWKRILAKARKQHEDRIRMSEQNLAELEKPLPMRLKEEQVLRELEEEQRNKGLKLAKKWLELNREARFQCLIYSLKNASWMAVSVSNANPKFGRELPGGGHGVDPRSYMAWAEPSVRGLAAELAAKPDVRCVVVVDLFSQDTPTVLAYVHDDGKGAQTGTAPPFPELEQPLIDFIHHLQTAAE